MRIVLDTNILVRAGARTSGPARAVLDKITSGPHVLLISEFILNEITRVLNYPRLQAHWPVTMSEIEEFTSELRRRAGFVELPPAQRWPRTRMMIR
jgi:predicted nucleic acid-binding protein